MTYALANEISLPYPSLDAGFTTRERHMNIETIEKLVQLGVGVLCVIALIAFIYIELVNPDLSLSDRAFWALVALGGSALALKDLQAIIRGNGRGGGSDSSRADRESSRTDPYHRSETPDTTGTSTFRQDRQRDIDQERERERKQEDDRTGGDRSGDER